MLYHMINIWFYENDIMIICFEFVHIVIKIDIDPHQLTIRKLDKPSQ